MIFGDVFIIFFKKTMREKSVFLTLKTGVRNVMFFVCRGFYFGFFGHATSLQ
jgi:hypothetical protein